MGGLGKTLLIHSIHLRIGIRSRGLSGLGSNRILVLKWAGCRFDRPLPPFSGK